jgi:hypothetical protein
MTRKLRPLLAAAMALTAFGVLAGSGAQAAEFHCSVEPCRVTMKPDGVVPSKTAHQVILFGNGVESFSTTCNSVTGEATMNSKTSSELTMSNINGEGCTIAGKASTLKANGCDYLLRSAGTLTINCPEGKEIENNGFECNYNIPAQGPLGGVAYHNISATEVTAELHVKLSVKASGSSCPWGTVTGEFTTSNVLLTSETPIGVMANFWWE